LEMLHLDFESAVGFMGYRRFPRIQPSLPGNFPVGNNTTRAATTQDVLGHDNPGLRISR